VSKRYHGFETYGSRRSMTTWEHPKRMRLDRPPPTPPCGAASAKADKAKRADQNIAAWWRTDVLLLLWAPRDYCWTTQTPVRGAIGASLHLRVRRARWGPSRLSIPGRVPRLGAVISNMTLARSEHSPCIIHATSLALLTTTHFAGTARTHQMTIWSHPLAR